METRFVWMYLESSLTSGDFDHDAVWDIHRYVLRQRRIILAGIDPRTLMGPVLPDDLRRAALSIPHGWAASIFDNPDGDTGFRSYRSYVVLTL